MEDFDHVKQEEPNNLLFINVLNFFMFLLQVIVVTVGIGQFGLLNFSTRQEISQSYPTLITAASWIPATVIFALIVILLIWARAQLFPEFIQLRARDEVKHHYLGVALCQVVWDIMFCYSLVCVSLFASVAILCFLGLILYDQSQATFTDICNFSRLLDTKFAFVLYFGWMIYVCLWNLSVVLVDSNVSTNAQYWMALVSLVIFGITSFSTVFCKEAQYPISLLMAYVMVRTVRLSFVNYFYCTSQHSTSFFGCRLDWNHSRSQRRYRLEVSFWRRSSRCCQNYISTHWKLVYDCHWTSSCGLCCVAISEGTATDRYPCR
jgi:hypothetical protein